MLKYLPIAIVSGRDFFSEKSIQEEPVFFDPIFTETGIDNVESKPRLARIDLRKLGRISADLSALVSEAEESEFEEDAGTVSEVNDDLPDDNLNWHRV